MKETFRDRLRKLREETKKPSQKAFAEYLGISRANLAQYETSDRLPDAKTLLKISETCGVSTDYLLGLSEIRSRCDNVKVACSTTGLTEAAVEYLRNPTNHELRTEVFNILLSAGFDRVLAHIANYLYEIQNADRHRKPSKERLTAEFDAAQPGADFFVLNHDQMTAHYQTEAVKAFSRFLDIAIPAIVKEEACDHAINP